MATTDRYGPPPTPEGAQLEPYILDPAGQAAELVRWLEEQHAADRWLLRFGVRDLDEAITVAPPDLVAIAGRPSMGKSQVCKWLARVECDRILDEGDADSVVVVVTLEESSKKVSLGVNGTPVNMRAVKRGEFDLEEARRWALGVVARPLHIVRHPGLIGSGSTRSMAPSISAQLVLNAISRIADTTRRPVRVRMVIVDYLQLLREGNRVDEKAKMHEVASAVEGLLRVADALGCVVVMAVQAGRETDSRTPPLPTMADMQWGSVIEQACTLIVGCLRPIRHPAFAPKGGSVMPPALEFRGQEYPVTEEMFLLNIIKQKDDTGQGVHLLGLDVRTNTLGPYVDPLYRGWGGGS